MKSRRVILTIEVETDLPLATLRCVESMHFTSRDPAFPRVSIYETLQVQANAIRPEPKKVRWAKFAKEDARLAAADRLKQPGGIDWKRVHAADEILDQCRDAARQRKAKRAKGAK